MSARSSPRASDRPVAAVALDPLTARTAAARWVVLGLHEPELPRLTQHAA